MWVGPKVHYQLIPSEKSFEFNCSGIFARLVSNVYGIHLGSVNISTPLIGNQSSGSVMFFSRLTNAKQL